MTTEDLEPVMMAIPGEEEQEKTIDVPNLADNLRMTAQIETLKKKVTELRKQRDRHKSRAHELQEMIQKMETDGNQGSIERAGLKGQVRGLMQELDTYRKEMGNKTENPDLRRKVKERMSFLYNESDTSLEISSFISPRSTIGSTGGSSSSAAELQAAYKVIEELETTNQELKSKVALLQADNEQLLQQWRGDKERLRTLRQSNLFTDSTCTKDNENESNSVNNANTNNNTSSPIRSPYRTNNRGPLSPDRLSVTSMSSVTSNSMFSLHLPTVVERFRELHKSIIRTNLRQVHSRYPKLEKRELVVLSCKMLNRFKDEVKELQEASKTRYETALDAQQQRDDTTAPTPDMDEAEMENELWETIGPILLDVIDSRNTMNLLAETFVENPDFDRSYKRGTARYKPVQEGNSRTVSGLELYIDSDSDDDILSRSTW